MQEILFPNRIKIEVFFKFFSLFKTELLSLELPNHLSLMSIIFPNLIFEVRNYGIKFERGINYYRFEYVGKVNDDIARFQLLNFLTNVLYKVIRKENIYGYFKDTTYNLALMDLSFFSNLKLGNISYLNNVEDRMFISFSLLNEPSFEVTPESEAKRLQELINILTSFKVEIF
jgi:hypothetical protein